MIHHLLQETIAPHPALRAQVRSSALRWQPIGSLRSLYGRFGKEPAPRLLAHAEALADYGLIGDCHACSHSPRQLLIAGDDAYQRFDLPDAALRENLRVDFSTEHLQSGDLLRVGCDVVLWLTFHCEPCSLLERRCPGTINIIGQHRGILARVLRGGALRIDDEISLARSGIPAMSNDWRTRVLNVARAVPVGHYIVYRQLAEMAGVDTAYCRAFPKLLSKLPVDVSSRIRSGASSLPGSKWSGAELFDVSAFFS